ncbi:hypothetical protein ACFE04_017188 [Oxalis oulophora]
MLFMKCDISQTLFTLFRNLSKKNPKVLHRNFSYSKYKSSSFNSFSSLHNRDLSKRTLIFNVEGAILKSPSPFPYFMLVAFEAGSLLRALLLLLLYPIICLLNEEMGLKIMVMVSFFGLKKDKFRVGTSVLPKFFLEDVGLDMFEVLKNGGKKVGVSEYYPRVMIESFLRDYLEIDVVMGRELKVCCGYYVGVFEDRNDHKVFLEEIHGEGRIGFELIGISSFTSSLRLPIFSLCKEIYIVKLRDRRNWQQLPRDKYPKPLIFHDGRLAFRPTPSATLIMFLWAPIGFLLALIRAVVALTLPYTISIPILGFSGLDLTVTFPINSPKSQRKGTLYVCNHRSLLDPLYLAFTLKTNMVAVTFSPLFSEMSDVIVPVAVNSDVSMFYGTTASGLKCLDPLFLLMNPSPVYTVQILESVSGTSTCHDEDAKVSSFDVANGVQSRLGEALNFECTKLTRKDKYMILAGNEGHVVAGK